jgi:peptidoglycan/LPS O-acetylase OafA/YrhL
MGDKIIFLPGLNGIRAIAACGVLFSHINLALKKFGIYSISLFGFNKEGNPKSWVLGEHGVTMFFVLSGFLITYLLLKEFEKTKKIDIAKFYVRRILRIWPLYFLYILLIIAFFWNSLNLDFNLVYYLSFFANIPFVTGQSYIAMDHLWSISVEEQFYLFWPLLFLFLIQRKSFLSILTLIVIFSVFRIFIWYVSPLSTLALFSVVNRFDCMLFGGLGAYLLHKENRIINVLNMKIVQLACWFVLLLLIVNKFQFLNSIIEIFVVEFITLTIIIGQIKIRNKVVDLENKPLSYIGKLSFGLYVYHPLIITVFYKYLNFKYFDSAALNAGFIFMSVFCLSILVSHISYFYFEKRFLNVKLKYSVVTSSNSKGGSENM